MKDQYFGDINDYRKYGLLRTLIRVSQLRLGVCWLRTANDNRNDGEFRKYLNEPNRWRKFDSGLYTTMQRLLDPSITRSVLLADEWRILPNAVYNHSYIRDDKYNRDIYFAKNWDLFKACQVIFFDPDNGLEVPSVKYGGRGSAKYLYWHELMATYAMGFSIVLYQHFPRKPRSMFTSSVAIDIVKLLKAPLVDSFQTAHVVFFLIAQPEHVALFDKVHDEVLRSWRGQINPASHIVA